MVDKRIMSEEHNLNIFLLCHYRELQDKVVIFGTSFVDGVDTFLSHGDQYFLLDAGGVST